MRSHLGKVAAWLGRRAQPASLAADNPFKGFSEEEVKATLEAGLRGAFDAGRQAERDRIAAILQAPGASTFREIAMDLALGDATSAQAIAVLTRAETDAATRAGVIKSNLIERASADVPTLH
jgi:hypothetical protein